MTTEPQPDLPLDEFARRIAESGVIPATELEDARNSVADRGVTSADFAQHLVRQKQLTEFQVRTICDGDASSLVLGNYLVLDKIGQGGMGRVYRARHQRMRRIVALKVLPPSLTDDRVALSRFQREVEAAAQLSHPNVVTAFDADEHNGVFFFVMEYVDGLDLAAHVEKQGPLPAERGVDYVLQAARGLAYAHDKGVIHRDIKPSNLLVNDEGAVKVLDLGIARVQRTDGDQETAQEGLTSTGLVMGTADYMSPEQGLDTKSADTRSDIYSLGCTLYFLLTGQAPYCEEDTFVKKILAHRDQPVPQLASRSNSASPLPAQVFERMVAKNPDDRFQTMHEVDDALTKFQAGDTSVAAPSGRVRTSPTLMSTTFRSFAIGAHGTKTHSVGFSHDGQQAISSGDDGRIALWSVRYRTKAGSIPGHKGPAYSARFTTDDQFVVSGGEDHLVRLSEVRSGTPVLAFRGHDGPVRCVAVASNGRWIASAGDDRRILLWDLKTRKLVRRFKGHVDSVRSVDFSPDCWRIVSGDADGLICLWDVKQGVELPAKMGTPEAVNRVLFMRDGEHVLSCGDDSTIRVWNTSTGKESRRFVDVLRPALGIALTADNSMLVSGGRTGRVDIWDVEAGVTVQSFEGHNDWVSSVAVSPDGQVLLSGGLDSNVLLWEPEGKAASSN